MTKLGDIFKKIVNDNETSSKEKKNASSIMKKVKRHRLQEDFHIVMRRLREDLQFSIEHNRALPVIGVHHSFIQTAETIAKQHERMLNVALHPIWEENKQWAKKQGLKLVMDKQKDPQYVHEWYIIYFTAGDKK